MSSNSENQDQEPEHARFYRLDRSWSRDGGDHPLGISPSGPYMGRPFPDHRAAGQVGCHTDPVGFFAMDYERAAADLGDYLRHVSECQNLPALTRDRRAALKSLKIEAVRVNRILASLTPDHALISGSSLASHQVAVPVVERAQALITDSHRNLESRNDRDETVVTLTVLHPLVYTPALGHWEAGHYRSAVSDAATSVSQYAQWRLGRYDVAEKDLMAQAFTDKPPEQGKPRLRCPGNPNSQTVQSQQQGAMLFSMGCYAAFRNPAQHLTGDWNPRTAFQHLAAFSIVAQWVQDWQLVVAPPVIVDVLAAAQRVQAASQRANQ